METDHQNQESLTFSQKCRLCLCSAGVVNLFESVCLVEDILSCTGVTIHNSDNLPQKICLKCCETVANAKELRQMVTANEALLSSLFDDSDKTDHSPEDVKQTPGKTKTVNTDVKNPPEQGCTSKRRKTDLTPTHEERTKNSKDSSKKMKSPKSETNSESKSRNTINVRKDLFKVSDTSVDKNPVINQEFKAKLSLLGVNLEEYSCQVCSKVFDTYKKLYLHQRLHNKNIVCPLDMCGKTFSTKGDLEKHIRTHTGEKPFQCDICEKSFTQRASLKSHRENVHSRFKYN